jgi:hypothetical protein
MRILVYNRTGTRLKSVFRNDFGKSNAFLNLTYSSSLQGIGTCSFETPQKNPNDIIGKNYYDLIRDDIIGLERMYIEDDFGNIVWGGFNTSFRATENKTAFVCTEMKNYFTRIKSPIKEISGNGLDSIKSILNSINSEIKIHEDSEIVDDAKIRLGENATVYDAIKSIINATYSRWILIHEKKDGLIETKLLCRSIKGVMPEGIGLDRSRYSKEVEDKDKRYFIYNEVDNNRNNVLSFTVNQIHDSVVTKCTVRYKEDGVSKSVTSAVTPTSLYIESLFGVHEKVISSNEIITTEHAQIVADREIVAPETEVTINAYPEKEDKISVGDRVDFQIFSGAFITAGLDGDNNVIVGSSRYRVEEKKVVYKDGYLEISYKLTQRNTVPYSYTLTEKIADIKRTNDRINADIVG